MSLRQFSAVSCVHLCPSTHQSQGKDEDTHWVHEMYVLQSKKVKLVATKSGPDVMRTDSLAVKWSRKQKRPLAIRQTTKAKDLARPSLDLHRLGCFTGPLPIKRH